MYTDSVLAAIKLLAERVGIWLKLPSLLASFERIHNHFWRLVGEWRQHNGNIKSFASPWHDQPSRSHCGTRYGWISFALISGWMVVVIRLFGVASWRIQDSIRNKILKKIRGQTNAFFFFKHFYNSVAIIFCASTCLCFLSFFFLFNKGLFWLFGLSTVQKVQFYSDL